MIIRKKLIYFRQHDNAGRIFLPEEVDYKDNVYGSLDVDIDDIVNGLTVERIAAIGKVDFKYDGIYIDISIRDNFQGDRFKEMFGDGYHVCPIGTGRFDNDYVRDYFLHYFILTKTPTWNENESNIK